MDHHYVLIGFLSLLYTLALALAFFSSGRRTAWIVALLTIPLGASALYLVEHVAFGHGHASESHDIELLIAAILAASGLLVFIVLRK